jgi:hypothetical protein
LLKAPRGAKTIENLPPEAQRRFEATKVKCASRANVKGLAKKRDLKQIDCIVKEEGLTQGQRELLHRAITKEGYSLEEIREIAKEIKELYPNK